MEPKRILFCEHSHMARLQGVVSRPYSHFFNFKEQNLECVWHVQGGLRVEQLLVKPGARVSRNGFAIDLNNILDDLQPSSMIIAIGDNDVGRDRPELVALKIFNYVAAILNKNPQLKMITMLQLLPRYYGARGDIEAYNIEAHEINERLLSLAHFLLDWGGAAT